MNGCALDIQNLQQYIFHLQQIQDTVRNVVCPINAVRAAALLNSVRLYTCCGFESNSRSYLHSRALLQCLCSKIVFNEYSALSRRRVKACDKKDLCHIESAKESSVWLISSINTSLVARGFSLQQFHRLQQLSARKLTSIKNSD